MSDAAPVSRSRHRWDAAFAADLHLAPSDPGGLARATRLVQQCRESTELLVLLGDVFDLWISGALLQLEEWRPLYEACREATRDGLAIHFLPGNRDFLLSARDGQTLGWTVHGEEWDLDVAGTRLRLLHGDQLLTRDRAYQWYKRAVRSRPMRAFARTMPRSLCFRLARRLRAVSTDAVAGKSTHEMGVVDEEVRARLQGRDAVLCGHVHRADRRRYPEGELLVLPPFCDAGRFLSLSAGEFREHRPGEEGVPFLPQGARAVAGAAPDTEPEPGGSGPGR